MSYAPISSRLTVYSKSGHVVQQYPKDTRTVTLPKSVDVGSIVAISSKGEVVPFSYFPETNSGISLVNRYTGDKVDATVIKKDKLLIGKILSMDSDNVTVITQGKITNVRNYDQVVVNVDDDYTRPYLALNNSDETFTISYLLSNISWACIGTAFVDKINNLIYLRLAGKISNKTESNILATTFLVSGDVYQNKSSDYDLTYSTRSFKMLASASPRPISGKNSESSMLEDFVKFDVGNRMIRDSDIAELGTSSFPTSKLYIHKTSKSDIVRFGYRFTSTGFIPSCSLNIYSIKEDYSIDSYLGSDSIDETQKDDEVDIILGESTVFQCKSQIIVSNLSPDDKTLRKYNLQNSPNNSWKLLTEDLTVEINNHNTIDSLLIIKHYVGNKKLISIDCDSYKKRDDDHIEWLFQIPPGKQTFTCKIITASYL